MESVEQRHLLEFQENDAGAGEERRLSTFQKIVWIFVISCFIGYIIEMVFCMVYHGKIENRQGVLYGPFNQIYGFGAIVMYFMVLPASKHGLMPTFLTGALFGGAVEFVCSYVEEYIFGTRSWDYSGDVFSFSGRTSLSMVLAWGALGVVFVQWIYPVLEKGMDRIKCTQNNTVCAVVLAFFVLNLSLSGLAVNRWMERMQGQPANSRIDLFLDEVYPNDRMRFHYPGMEPINKKPVRVRVYAAASPVFPVLCYGKKPFLEGENGYV